MRRPSRSTCRRSEIGMTTPTIKMNSGNSRSYAVSPTHSGCSTSMPTSQLMVSSSGPFPASMSRTASPVLTRAIVQIMSNPRSASTASIRAGDRGGTLGSAVAGSDPRATDPASDRGAASLSVLTTGPRSFGLLGALAQDEFLNLPGRGLRQRPEYNVVRRLEMGQALAAERDDVGGIGMGAVLEHHKGARRLAPLRVRSRDNGGFEHRRVAVQHVLDLDRRDVLAARDDDVLRAVLDLDITVRVGNGEIAGMEPAAGEGLLGRDRILQIAFHDDVAAHEDFSGRLAVARNRFKRLRIGHHQPFQYRIAHALARLEPGPLVAGTGVPFVVPRADDRRAVDLGQPVDMRDAEAEI